VYALFAVTLNATHSFDKDEQITGILPTPAMIRGSRQEDDEKQIRIRDVKKEIAAECNNLFDHLQGQFGRIQTSFQKHQQRTERSFQSIQSKQKECGVSHAGLAHRIDRIEDERNVLSGDLTLIKNDVNGEFVNSIGVFTNLVVALFESSQVSPEHDLPHNHSDGFRLVPLSDELLRAEAVSSTICRLHLQELWSRFHARFPTVSVDVSHSLNACIPVVQLSARRVVLGLLLLLIVIVFLFLFVFVSSEGPELYMTTRKIRRIQKNVHYHSNQ
jgi:hypothetical protein